MRVLLVGGTGFIGRHLCDELLERGHQVVALSRYPSEKTIPEDVVTIPKDVRSYDSIADAFEGVDAAINLVALSPVFEPEGGNESHDLVHRQGTDNCVRAAERHDVDRFVQVSALGVDAIDTHYTRAKREAEAIVRESSLSWTIVRPSVVFGEDGEFVEMTKSMTPPHVTPLPGGGRMRLHPIYVGDLVPVLADVLTDQSPAHTGETYEIGGPEVVSMADIGRSIREADGQTIRVVPVPYPIVRVAFSVLGAVPFAPVGPDQYRSLTVDNVAEENHLYEFDCAPEELTTVQEYLSTNGQ